MDNVSAKQKIIIQAVCILLSIGLWFYVTNIESPTTTYELSRVPVELNNVDILKDVGLALAPNQNFYVTLKLEGSTQDIFKASRNDFKVNIDLSEYALKVGENKVPVSIVDFPSKITIKNNGGLTVKIIIEERVNKDVSIASNINIIAKSGYYVAPPTFNPETVTISGPKSLVDRVYDVLAEGTEENIGDTVVKSYFLECVDEYGDIVEGIEISQETVIATIEVNEGKSVPIKINTIGSLKDNIKLKSIESTIKQVGISGSKEALDSIHEIETEPIDLSKIESYTEVNTKLVIPDGVQIYQGQEVTTVEIIVDKVESREVTVAFSLINVATGITVVPNVHQINVKVSGYAEEINKITSDKIKAELDLTKYNEEGSFSEKPKVTLIDEDSAILVEPLGEITFDIIKETEETQESQQALHEAE